MNDEIRAYVDNLDDEYLPAPITSPDDLSDEPTKGVVLELVKVGDNYTAVSVKRRPLPEKVEVDDPRGWLQRFKDNLVMRFYSDERKRKILQRIDNERTFAQTESQYEFLKEYAEIIEVDITELRGSYEDLRAYRNTLREAIEQASRVVQGTESGIERMIAEVRDIEVDLDSEEFPDEAIYGVEDSSVLAKESLKSERERLRETIPRLDKERDYLKVIIKEMEGNRATCEESLRTIDKSLVKASTQRRDLRRTLHVYERVTLPQLKAARSVQNLEEAAGIAHDLKSNMNKVDTMLGDAVTGYLQTPDGEIAPDPERALAQKEVRQLIDGS